VTDLVVTVVGGLAAVVVVGVPLAVAMVFGEVMDRRGPGQGRYPFTDVAGGARCVLVVPPDAGAGYPQLRAGVEHPGCGQLADLAVELDAFYCPGCGYNGRVPGGWCLAMIDAAGGA
jgi:hypothetical protein